MYLLINKIASQVAANIIQEIKRQLGKKSIGQPMLLTLLNPIQRRICISY